MRYQRVGYNPQRDRIKNNYLIMQSITVSKVAVIAVAVALVFGSAFAVTATKAHAITAAELLDLLIALDIVPADKVDEAKAALGDSGGSSSGGGCGFTRDLTVGSSGADVTCLQDYLTGTGHFTFSGGSTGFFGPVTQSAVAAWQAANGISPAAGYFGPVSRSAYEAMMGGGSGSGSGAGDDDDDDGGPVSLSGGAGSISDADFISGLNNEEVGEDESDVAVAGLEVEADEGSDLMLVAVNLDFDPGTGVGSNDFDEYADDVSIWFDGEEFARVDASDFEDDDNFDKTITLDEGAVIEADETGDLEVRVSGVNNLDSADQGDTWTLIFTNVRFEDGSGAIITETTQGDIGTETRTFSFESFASAADVDLKAQISDDTPESGVVNVDDSDDTDKVELLRFTLEAEGDSDLRVRDIPITFTPGGGTADEVDDIINTAYVTIDGEEFSENVSTGAGAASITFDDFDYTIPAGDEVDVVVEADVNDTEAGSFADGDTLVASFTASNREVMDAEDESGEDIGSSDRSGTASGEILAFYDVGPMVTFVSASESVQVDDGADDDTGTFVVKYRVEAFDGTIYLSDSASATIAETIPDTTVTTAGPRYFVDQSGTPTTADLSDVVTFSDVTGDPTDTGVTNGVEIEEGEVAEFTLTVTRTNSGDSTDSGLFRVLLKAITWATTDASTQNIYDFNLEDFKTDPVSLD